MTSSTKIVQASYAIAIACMFPYAINLLLQLLNIVNPLFFILSTIIGLPLIFLSLTHYENGLSLGLMFTGIIIVLNGSYDYIRQAEYAFNFLGSCAILLVIAYVWYKHVNQQ